MKTVGQVLSQSQTGQTRQSWTRSVTYSHSEQQFIEIWRGLQAAKFLTKDELVNGTDYKYWRANLHDMTDEQLVLGLDASRNFHGFMTWSEFRKLCVDSTKSFAAHKFYLPPPVGRKPTDPERLAFIADRKARTGI